MEKLSPLYTSAYWRKSHPDLSDAIYQVKSEVAQEYKQAAITHKNISIVGLPGQEITLKEAKQGLFWQDDPYPNLESQLLTRSFDVIGGKATLFGGEAKLWQHLQETVNEIARDNQIFLDIHNLTPPEAVLLIKELIRRKLNYDDLIAGSVSTEKINANKVRTAKPEFLDYFTKDYKKYQKLAKSYSNKVGYMTSDQIIKHGFAVCRHVAAVASVLYQVLRNNQHSILLNGSYLLYHGEKFGSQWPKACIGDHSYNILYVTHPKHNAIEISLSVIDTTYTMSSNNFLSDPDYTPTRLSQACSSLFEYASLFDINQKVVTNLADLALKRTKTNLDKGKAIFNYQERSAIIDEYLADYASLAFQGTPGKNKKALEVVYQAYQKDGLSREDMLVDLLNIHPVTYESNNEQLIKRAWVPEVIEQLNKINFSKRTTTQADIFKKLTPTAINISTNMLVNSRTGDLMSYLDTYHKISEYF